ncbi:MAG: UDP-glucuronic acid decarboxylase family protein [Pseudomonadota bacterium]
MEKKEHYLPKRILVTGGAGFLGSHLCERLLEGGNDVICLDNFFTGNKLNIERLMDNHRFELIDHDVTHPITLEVDAIYNLASPASPIHYQRDPVRTTRTCVLGAVNMLDIARQSNAVILQASTSEVYGDPQVQPQTETYWGHANPIGVRSCYDEGKRCAETLFFDYYRQYRTNIKVARIFNTYGPRMHPDDGRVVSNFIVQALRGEPLTLYGDGSQVRAFCYVDDMVEGFIKLMNQPESFTGPVNLGNPMGIPIRQLAETILELTGSSSEIIYRPLPEDDPKQREPDIRLAKEKLAWQPSTSLLNGLGRTINYFDALL